MGHFSRILKSEAKASAIYSISTAINRVGGFLLLPLFWQKLTPHDYGIIAIVNIVEAIPSVVLGLSLDMYVSRFFFSWPDHEKRRNLGMVWVVSWISIIAFGLMVLLSGPKIVAALFPAVQYYPFIFLGLLGSILYSFSRVPLVTIRINQMPWLFAGYNLVNFVIGNGLSILYILIWDKGLTGFLIARIWTEITMTFLLGIMMFFFAEPCLRKAGFLAAMKFSLPIIPSQIISAATSVIDSFLLQRFASIEALGIYSLCEKFIRIINELHNSLKLSFVPFMMKTATVEEQGKATIAKIVPYYIFPYFLAALAVALYIKDYVMWINQSSYYPIFKYLPFLLIAAVINLLYPYYSSGIILSKKTKLLWIPSAIQMIVLVTFALLFIRPLQMWGMVISYNAKIITYIGVSLLISQRVYPMPHKFGHLMIYFLSAIALYLVRQLLPDGNLGLNILINTSVMAIFLALVLAFILDGRSLLQQIRIRLAAISNLLPSTISNAVSPPDHERG